MVLFSERYGYTKPSEVLIRETITKVINAGKMKSERVEKFKELLELMEQYKRINQYQ